jgi:valyl-tRNA synthetase
LTGNYLEFVKAIKTEEQIKNALNIFIEVLIMLHPFVPFITEQVYGNLSEIVEVKESILLEKYPVIKNVKVDKEFERIMLSFFKVARISDSMPERNKQKITLSIQTPYGELKDLDLINEMLIKVLNAEIVSEVPSEAALVKIFPQVGIIFSTFEGVELQNITELKNKEKEFLSSELQRAERMLSNEKFVANASPELVEAEKEKVEFYKESIKLINEN